MNNSTLWYKKEASIWEDALPLGNGSFGAMVYGGVKVEQLKLNLDTFWSGYKKDKTNYESINHLKECRELIKEKKYYEAGDLLSNLSCEYSESYLAVGNMIIEDLNEGEVSEYYRDLNLSSGIATTSYILNGVKFTRKVFISYVDKIMVIKIKADKPNINLKISADSEVKYQTQSLTNNEISMQGTGPSVLLKRITEGNGAIYDEDNVGISFCVNVEGSVETGSIESLNGELLVKDADSLVLIVAAKTNYDSQKNNIVAAKEDISNDCDKLIQAAKIKGYEKLEKDHIKDFESLYKKSEINFDTVEVNELPTDERILKVQ